MELRGLNSAFENIGYIPFVNLQWRRRYYEPGEFSVQIRADDYDPAMRYVIATNRPEIGMIQRIYTTDTMKGRFVQMEGYFLEKALDRSVVFPLFTRTGTPPVIAQAAVSAFPPDGLTLNVDAALTTGTSTEVEWHGEEVGRALYDLLKTQEYSHKITLDYQANTLTYGVWRGKNRTQSQTNNAFAIFSDSSAAVEEFKLTEDSSGYKNFAVIAYGDESSPSYIYVDKRKIGEEKRQIFVDYIGSNEEKTAMRQDAAERLQQYEFIRNAELKVIQSGMFYLKDYDLGDKCDVVNHRLQKSYEARIIEIDEVFKANQHLVSIAFGEKIPTNYSKLSRLARNMRR
jgi:hypothetical protein